MAEPEWTVLAQAGRARFLDFGKQGEPPCVVEELSDPLATPDPVRPRSDADMRRFARQVVDRLEQAYSQARFEFLRIAVEPRFMAALRAEIDRHLDLHRAVLEWRVLDVVPFDDMEALQQLRSCGSG